MKAVVQRVKQASVEVGGEIIAQIHQGVLVFIGIEKGDDDSLCAKMADKIAGLRIFEDEQGRMSLDIAQISGHVLLVSQFTLAADLNSGRRPSFSTAESPSKARIMYMKVADQLALRDITVEMGRFGADMQVALVNDGPATFLIEL